MSHLRYGLRSEPESVAFGSRRLESAKAGFGREPREGGSFGRSSLGVSRVPAALTASSFQTASLPASSPIGVPSPLVAGRWPLATTVLGGSRNLDWWSRKLDRCWACGAAGSWSTFSGLPVRQLTGGTGTTERRYWAPTGRPDPSGSWSPGRRENPERVDASADAPSGFFACPRR